MVNSSSPLSIASVRSEILGDRWLLFLAVVLAGYAFIGKGFAYVGFPPLFIGEMTYLSGVFVLLRSRCLLGSLATLPSFLLAVSMAWVVLRTVPYVGTYGVDALRDSVVILYGGFAFIVIALLLEDRRRIDTILRYYDRFAGVFVLVIPFLYASSHFLGEYIPEMPNASVPILGVRSGEVAAHLAGASVFALVGFCRVGWLWIIGLCAAIVMVASQGRGAMFAFVVPVILAAILVGKARALARVVVLTSIMMFAAFTVESTFGEYPSPTSAHDRSISAQQIVYNVISSFTDTDTDNDQQGTKIWRLKWWNIIYADTLFGPNFWTGRGFGLNLADADGFQDLEGPDRPKLRSPHNVHMTILARAGVPGLVLWSAFLLSWFAAMLRAAQTAQRRGQVAWSRLFLFVMFYALSIVIDASFDVVIEGPMIGIWFWCLIGFGIGIVMVFRADRKIVR